MLTLIQCRIVHLQDTLWPAAAARRGEIDNNYGLQSRYRVVADYPHPSTGGSVGGTSWRRQWRAPQISALDRRILSRFMPVDVDESFCRHLDTENGACLYIESQVSHTVVWTAPGTTRPLLLGSRGPEADCVELARLDL